MLIDKRNFLLCLVIALALSFLAGGCSTPEAPACVHDYGPLCSAVPADLFREGTIAHYQCSQCGGYFDSAKTPVDSVTVPREIPELYLCVNGQSVSLPLTGDDPRQLTWELDGFTGFKGDVITLQDASGSSLPFAADGGILDQRGALRSSLTGTTAVLVATPEAVTLTIQDNRHPGIVAQINGTQHPMTLTHYLDSGVTTYLRGYFTLSAGDTLCVMDNPQEVVYGFDQLSRDLDWNTRDYHRGAQGELVIDSPGRYLLEFDRGGDKRIRISKVFNPREGNSFRLVFPDSDLAEIPLEECPLPQDAALSWFVNLDMAENHSDIAAVLANGGLIAYSAVLTPESGTVFQIDTGSGIISGDRVTEITGNGQCVLIENNIVEFAEAGTYLVSYLPVTDSIHITQLGTAGPREAAKSFDKTIAAIPSGAESDYHCQIRQLYDTYAMLTDSFCSRLNTTAKLETLRGNLPASNAVVYHLAGSEIGSLYSSKEALYRGFYTDFYYYIAACHGTEQLRKYNIHCAGDLVALAKDFDGRNLPNLYAIGYVAGIYFLEYDANGILENQSDAGFLGFCHSNGMYRELLPFLIRFFAYWRIDEGYANSSNPGADIFAEAWAPTVDIAKFFYYDQDTSYVQSPRVLDCFTNPAGVVYGLDGEDPLPVLRLRGYIFEGWYDNPDYTGEPLAQLPSTAGTCHLYAKWRADKAQQDADAAALVDIYIHNLTTKAARRKAATVGYVKAMYDALSPEAKAMVTEYCTLEAYIKQYL